MRKHIVLFYLIILSASCFAQTVTKTVGIVYTAGAPTHVPAAKVGSQVAIDTATWEWYEYSGSAWIASGDRIQSISGCSAPNYTPTKYQSSMVINTCTVLQNGHGPELYKYTGSEWLCLNCSTGTNIYAGSGITLSGTAPDITISADDSSPTNELQTLSIDGNDLTLSDGGGTVTLPGGGPDSTLSKIDDTYAGKRLSDNVYKYGTMGIGTKDTLGVLGVSVESDASDKVRLFLAGNGSYISKIPKHTSSTSRVIQPWYTGKSYSANAGFAGENEVFNGGINYSPGGGHVDRYANAAGWAIENNYKNASSEPGEPGHGFYELQWPEIIYSDTVIGSDGVKRATGVADNTKRRMISGYASNQKPGYGGYFSMSTDQVPITDFKTGTPKLVLTVAENMPNIKGLDCLDTFFLRMNKNNAGGILWANAAQNAFLGLFKVDASNRVVIGYNNVNTLYTEAQTLNSNGPFTIAPLASQPLTLGSTSTTSGIEIASVSALPVIFKSSVNTGGYGMVVNNSEFGIRDMSTNADMILLSKGTPAGAIWSRAPSGNIGIGGFPASDIPLEVKKSSQAVSGKLFGVTNASGTSVIYRSNATPSVGSAGDITMTNISGVGDLWVHDGTANRALAKVIKASATLDFSSTSAASGSDLTVSVTGASVGDPVSVAPGATNANSCVTAWVSATNTVTVRFNNYSASPVDPASSTYKVIVTKY